ncbi:MAG: hypothetical protein KKE08_16705, partial [Gammaproteobacteria bacterium]|nr:hypothetical protein [Gammaproteobacteria bacterium]MBU2205669.1 hypothetical protein [Gammaproteobacteria bacterium]
MRVRWKKNKNLKPEVVLAKLESSKTVSDDKRVSFSLWEYDEIMSALINMVEFPRHCDGFDYERIVSAAVSNIARSMALDKVKVIDEINEIIKLENSISEQEFHLLTKVSLAQPYPIEELVLENAKIEIFNDSYPEKFLGRNEVISKYPEISKTPEHYANVIVSLKEKTVRRAATKSLRVLDLVRSLFCLFGNPTGEILGGQWKPINVVRLGSAHTVHKDTGEIASKDFWYEPNFSPAKVFKPNNLDVFTKNCKWAMEKLELIPYGSILKDSLLRYVRALDERDQNTAMIRLWGAIEGLVAPSENNYDLVTRRCAFLFDDYEYHKQILEHLREYRNANVHSGDDLSPDFNTMTLMRFPIKWSQWRSQNEKTLYRRTNHQSYQ